MSPTVDAPEDGPANHRARPELPRLLGGPWAYIVLGIALMVLGISFWRPVPAGVWHDDGVYLLIGLVSTLGALGLFALLAEVVFGGAIQAADEAKKDVVFGDSPAGADVLAAAMIV